MKRILLEMEKLKNPNSGLGQFCLNLGEQFNTINAKDLQLDFYLPSEKKKYFGENITRHLVLGTLYFVPALNSHYILLLHLEDLVNL